MKVRAAKSGGASAQLMNEDDNVCSSLSGECRQRKTGNPGPQRGGLSGGEGRRGNGGEPGKKSAKGLAGVVLASVKMCSR